MKYPTPDYRVRHARTMRAARALAQLAGLPINERPDSLLPHHAEYLYVPKADLIIAPWLHDVRGAHKSIELCARETWCDAVEVSLAPTRFGLEMVRACIGLRRGDRFDWHNGLQLWLSEDVQECWLVPCANSDAPDGPCFRLNPHHLQPIEKRPWRNEFDHGHGHCFAAAQVTRLMNESDQG